MSYPVVKGLYRVEHVIKGTQPVTLGGTAQDVMADNEHRRVVEGTSITAKALQPGDPVYNLWPFRQRIASLYFRFSVAIPSCPEHKENFVFPALSGHETGLDVHPVQRRPCRDDALAQPLLPARTAIVRRGLDNLAHRRTNMC